MDTYAGQASCRYSVGSAPGNFSEIVSGPSRKGMTGDAWQDVSRISAATPDSLLPEGFCPLEAKGPI